MAGQLVLKSMRKLMIKPTSGYISAYNTQARLMDGIIKPTILKPEVNHENQQSINVDRKQTFPDNLSINIHNYYGPTYQNYGSLHQDMHGNTHYHNDPHHPERVYQQTTDITQKLLNSIKSIALVIFVGASIFVGFNLSMYKQEPATLPRCFLALKALWDLLRSYF